MAGRYKQTSDLEDQAMYYFNIVVPQIEDLRLNKRVYSKSEIAKFFNLSLDTVKNRIREEAYKDNHLQNYRENLIETFKDYKDLTDVSFVRENTDPTLEQNVTLESLHISTERIHRRQTELEATLQLIIRKLDQPQQPQQPTENLQLLQQILQLQEQQTKEHKKIMECLEHLHREHFQLKQQIPIRHDQLNTEVRQILQSHQQEQIQRLLYQQEQILQILQQQDTQPTKDTQDIQPIKDTLNINTVPNGKIPTPPWQRKYTLNINTVPNGKIPTPPTQDTQPTEQTAEITQEDSHSHSNLESFLF